MADLANGAPGSKTDHQMDPEIYRVLEEKKYRNLEKKAKRRAGDDDVPTLKMDSLMDIFTNILIYLLMNFSTQPVALSQTDELTIPNSNTKLALEHTVAVAVTKSAILVDRKKVCDIRDGRVDASLKKDRQASSYYITPLFEALKVAATKKKRIAKYNKEVKFEGLITVVGDHRVPFRLLSEVMYTAGQAEFGRFKFAVIKTGD